MSYSRDNIRLYSRHCTALDPQGRTTVFRAPCPPHRRFLVLFNDHNSRNYPCSYGAEKAWGIRSNYG